MKSVHSIIYILIPIVYISIRVIHFYILTYDIYIKTEVITPYGSNDPLFTYYSCSIANT